MPANCQFSGYDDISVVPDEATDFVWWYQIPLKFDNESIISEIETYIPKIKLVLPTIGSRQLIIFTLTDYLSVQIEIKDNRLKGAVSSFNKGIYDLANNYSNVKIVDVTTFTNQYSASELIDWKMFFLSQIPINPKLSVAFKEWFEIQTRAISLQRKKCLVLDLDNTLWGGVLGEDGVNNLAISGSYPGKAYHLWQQGLKQLKQNGVILCLCSKNNMNDVEDVWSKRDDMILKKEDFAAMRINWDDKATNIIDIAKELNIGPDSMVFADDNPTERELIKRMLPMVTVPEFPIQPYDLPKFYQSLVSKYFQIYALTTEDKVKTEQYRLNKQRNEAASLFSDFTDYLRSLKIQLTIEQITEQTLPRATQLTQKTNQFNLTTKRYSEADIRGLLADGARGWTLDVADKFGDYGITGLIIITKNGLIDTMLMSCRVLGKGVENVFLKSVLSILRKNRLDSVVGEYDKTAKNVQTADFYPNNGFSVVEKTEEHSIYTLQLNDADLSVNDYYKIIIK